MLAPENQKKIHVNSTLDKGSIFTFVLENKNFQQRNTPAFARSESLDEDIEELSAGIQLKAFDKIQTLTSSSPSSPDLERFVLTNICSCTKVLIVDDNPFNTMTLETILRSIKVKCDSVYSGFCALEKLLHRKINSCGDNCKPHSVIFMDQEMPGMSGAETVKETKKLQGENKVSLGMRIIGCTAHKAKEEVDRFLASGLERCIFKPLSIAMIKDTLKEI